MLITLTSLPIANGLRATLREPLEREKIRKVATNTKSAEGPMVNTDSSNSLVKSNAVLESGSTNGPNVSSVALQVEFAIWKDVERSVSSSRPQGK